jgi:hypothetical protein
MHIIIVLHTHTHTHTTKSHAHRRLVSAHSTSQPASQPARLSSCLLPTMLWRPAAMARGARWPGGGGIGGGRIGAISFAALQLLLLSTRPWAFFLPPRGLGHGPDQRWPLHQQQQRRGFAASTTTRHAFYTNDDGLLVPRLRTDDWVRFGLVVSTRATTRATYQPVNW